MFLLIMILGLWSPLPITALEWWGNHQSAKELLRISDSYWCEKAAEKLDKLSTSERREATSFLITQTAAEMEKEQTTITLPVWVKLYQSLSDKLPTPFAGTSTNLLACHKKLLPIYLLAAATEDDLVISALEKSYLVEDSQIGKIVSLHPKIAPQLIELLLKHLVPPGTNDDSSERYFGILMLQGEHGQNALINKVRDLDTNFLETSWQTVLGKMMEQIDQLPSEFKTLLNQDSGLDSAKKIFLFQQLVYSKFAPNIQKDFSAEIAELEKNADPKIRDTITDLLTATSNWSNGRLPSTLFYSNKLKNLEKIFNCKKVDCSTAIGFEAGMSALGEELWIYAINNASQVTKFSTNCSNSTLWAVRKTGEKTYTKSKLIDDDCFEEPSESNHARPPLPNVKVMPNIVEIKISEYQKSHGSDLEVKRWRLSPKLTLLRDSEGDRQ